MTVGWIEPCDLFNAASQSSFGFCCDFDCDSHGAGRGESSWELGTEFEFEFELGIEPPKIGERWKI